jgi:hypothetical protein
MFQCLPFLMNLCGRMDDEKILSKKEVEICSFVTPPLGFWLIVMTSCAPPNRLFLNLTTRFITDSLCANPSSLTYGRIKYRYPTMR